MVIPIINNMHFKNLIVFTSIFFNIASDNICQAQSTLELIGHWSGKGAIVADWCDQDSLAFDFSITTEGEISGTIGDAVITNSSYIIASTREDFKYELYLPLKGNIIECESVKRSRMTLLLNKDGEKLAGIFYSEGSFFGKKTTGILNGHSLVLLYK